MDFNYLAIVVAAVVPVVLGFIWYNPKVFGVAWMRAAEMTEAKIKGGNMAIIFSVSLVLSVILAFFTNFLVIHEFGVYGLTGGNLDAATTQAFLEEFEGTWRTYKHGALHGAMAGIMFALPVIGINALFERKNFKYILINAGYWIVCLTIMGSIISGWIA
ncbi:DUF1761 domain-containing protein [Psychroserpens burtonensis]|uniref:DUF1761 domain-containing protein n=1 Tax=Psychroserpens burtonensis TaxID=49278 RepID=A0A5C7BBA8_9FLAO|nr:DUF1761 domain-containing protein [Psychroserpens burtonensis]TXE19125.1 DUF1761 domain-containing protein [Psychroserpens burtonensis]